MEIPNGSSYVSELKATGIYGRFQFKHQFNPGINILHGRNGAGKTTFLHILANALNGHFRRFAYLPFKSIQLTIASGPTVVIRRSNLKSEATITVTIDDEIHTEFETINVYRDDKAVSKRDTTSQINIFGETSKIEPSPRIFSAAYFPAFRTMIEAWTTVQEKRIHRSYYNDDPEIKAKTTQFARELFGSFVPEINYPSPLEIELRLSTEIQEAIYEVAHHDQELLSDAFLNVFKALSSNEITEDKQPERILSEIKTLYDRLEEFSAESDSIVTASSVYTHIRNLVGSFTVHADSTTAVRILSVYRDILKSRTEMQSRSFIAINNYLKAVNEFFENKEITRQIANNEPYRRPVVGLKIGEKFVQGLRALSSGERQIVTLIYAATHMNEQRAVLIDEPELSLHVDWQRKLLRKMEEQLPSRQIIACTHSPAIAGDYYDNMQELVMFPIDPEVTLFNQG